MRFRQKALRITHTHTHTYETLSKKLGSMLLFTKFQCSVLEVLDVAPTKFLLNVWDFIHAFEILCEDLGQVPTINVFFYFFCEGYEENWLGLLN